MGGRMKRSSLHIAIGLATMAFLLLGPVSAQGRTNGGQVPAVQAPLAASLAVASADMSPEKSKAEDRDRDRRHSDDKDRRQRDDRDRSDKSRDDRDHDGDHNDRDHHEGDGDHNGGRCDDTEGLLSGLLCLLLG
jgi:hypothetical protein